jgi:subtilisin family serine protease
LRPGLTSRAVHYNTTKYLQQNVGRMGIAMGRKATRILLGSVFTLFCIALLVTGNLATCADTTSVSGNYSKTRILIEMRDGVTQSELNAIAAATNGTFVRKLSMGNLYTLDLAGTGSPVDALMASEQALLNKFPAVKNLYRDGISHIHDVTVQKPNDPLYPVWISSTDTTVYQGQWQMQPDPTTGIKHIDAPTAWALEKGSNRVVVAVLDTGCFTSTVTSGTNTFTTHPDLSGRLLTGYNAVADVSVSYPSLTYSESSHSTHVSGIIAAQGGNSVGVCGVCWNNVWVLPIRVCEDNGDIYDDALIDALNYCMSWSNTTALQDTTNPLKVNVINMSLGGAGYDGYLESVFHRAAQSGIIMVASAGNDGPDAAPLYPSAYDDVICVGASNYSDTVCDFSDRGPKVALVAPGWNVWSTTWNLPTTTPATSADGVYVPANSAYADDANGNGYRAESGTSMSAPHVSGAVALLLSYGVNKDDILPILEATATPRGSSQPNDDYGYGELNIGAALEKASLDISVTSPANGGVVEVSKPTIRIDLRHASIDNISVSLDGVLLVGPKGSNASIGYLSSAAGDATDANNLVGDVHVVDAASGKKYLQFQLTTALTGTAHTITATAAAGSSDLGGAAASLGPVTATSSFTYSPTTLSAGWHLFSVPYEVESGSDPGASLGYSGMLARYIHYYDASAVGSVSAAYAIYSLENPVQLAAGYTGVRVRKDNEATFAGIATADGNALWPAGFSGTDLVYSLSNSATESPAGLGYWLYLPSSKAVEVVGSAVPAAPYSIGAYHGWNMIGDPFSYNVPWSSVMVDLGGVRVSMADAVTNGWVSGNVYRWDPTSGAYTYVSVSSGYLVPWEAEWVRVTGTGPLSGTVDANGWPETDVRFIVSPTSSSND